MTDVDRLALVRHAINLQAGFAEHRLAWLQALLADLDQSQWYLDSDDPPAASEALWECRQLLNGLTAAFRDELDAQLEAERALLGEGPLPGDEWVPF